MAILKKGGLPVKNHSVMLYKKNKKENILPPHESLDPISPREVYTGIKEMIVERGEIKNLINQHGEQEKMIRGRGDSGQTGRRGGPGVGAAASPRSRLGKRKTTVIPHVRLQHREKPLTLERRKQ